ncbi:DUF932 domain-containing protein [Aggregicoccus sp. 17bor-14]|uniref:DUF932 domain-containing protein n=1 Tax=Myxococcaceae TaxID=31 RepID=UPI00129C378F|nr:MULTISPECIES: DUF932 domain-containing protein [Myxococcaceae]MBF5043172.1 DUF932 domain-containing protein [Simulacricoccus sp. 17bor-14]MRI88930.1 DUF932 domain-containing protein [Aggregicoccus sp. 17bor-14]
MPHDIHTMMYAGEVPWHGLGTQLPANADCEQVVEAAGFYRAEERELFIDGTLRPVPDRKALVRGDTGEYLAAVSRGYKTVQFEEVARCLVQASGDVGALFHTAGTLGRAGVRGWLLAELPQPLRVQGDKSPIRKYLLGYTGHDGATAITLKNVATRVVCANTLGVALGERQGAEWHIAHHGQPLAHLAEAAEAFRRLAEGYARFGQLANALAVTRFSDAQLATALDFVLPVPEDAHEHPRILGAREKVRELFEAGTGIEGPIRGTAWAALQAFTEYADHHRHTRALKGRRAEELRLESIWFGRAAALKHQALFAIAGESRLALAA